MAELRNKQKAFIEEYLTCWNATLAAIRAGYSERTAYSIGWENLRKPEIAEAIKQRLSEKHMSAEEVLERLSEQGRTSMEDFGDVSKMGTFQMDLNKAQQRGRLASVKKIRPTRYGYELELVDTQRALELVGKAHGMFTDGVRLSGDKDNPLDLRVVAIDYRAAIAPLAVGPDDDSDAPG